MGMYSPSVLFSAACFCPGSMLFPSQAVCRRVRAVSTAGVCRRHDRCRAPAHLPGSPVCRCRCHIRQDADGLALAIDYQKG